MGDMHRREMLKLVAAVPLATAFDWTPQEVERARGAVIATGKAASAAPTLVIAPAW